MLRLQLESKHLPPNLHDNAPAAANLTAADYIRLLHPTDGVGKVSFVLIRSRDETITKTYSVDTAPVVVDALLDESTYVSLNRFNGPRTSTRLAQLNALYLDLDVHTLPGSNQLPDHWAGSFASDLRAKNSPQPSVLISTGRGLAAIWLLEPLPAKARSRWNTTMQALIKLFQHMGADSACSDCARVFRVPGTINLKSGTEVRTMDGTLRRYNFDVLSDCIFIASGRPTRRKLKEIRQLKKKVTVATTQGNRRGLTPKARFTMIARDLDKIVVQWGGRVPLGHRNTFLHLLATCLTHTGPASEIETHVRRIAAMAVPDLSDREISGIIKSAETKAQESCSSNPSLDGRLHYSGAKVAELLNISDALACELSLEQTFSEAERARRKAGRERNRRRGQGACLREEWLAMNSTSRVKPWKLAGISRSKWYEQGHHKIGAYILN